MKQAKILGVLAALVLVGSGCSKPVVVPPASTAVVPPGYVTQAVKYYHFSISHPADWKTQSTGQNATAVEIMSPLTSDQDTFSENLNVIETGLKNNKVTLEEFFEGGRAKNQAMSGYKEISKTDTVLDGYPAKRLEFEVPYSLENGDSVNLHIIQYGALTPERAYTLTCTLETAIAKNYIESCDKMAGSLKMQTEANK